MLDAEEFGAWFRLIETPGLSRDTARALLAAFGAAEAVMSAGATRLRHVAGAELATALTTTHDVVESRLKFARAWLAEDPKDRHVVVLGGSAYPPSLLQTVDPPMLLYVQGQADCLSLPAIAVVGSRNPTPQGADNARAFAQTLSDAGLVVVSGLALGVDAAAHEGAMAGSSPTIAVVGTGLDRVYPARHRALAHRIAQTGAIVSEFAPGMPPLRENFPQRNRIIAGLTKGTLVVEAALQSGSLITARLASEAGRDVFAIPGSIHSPQSRGCHALLKQGAKLVESAQDILEDLHWSAQPLDLVPSPSSSAEDPVLRALGHDPATLDVLGARSGWSAAELSARLLELELSGQVSRLPGGLYQRRMAT